MTSPLRITFDVLSGRFDERMVALQTPLARAAKATMVKTGERVKTKGRAEIGNAGFSRKWQNAFRVNVYPERSISIDSAVWIYHRIPYAHVFEEGANIHGSPLLWLPLPNLPSRLGRNRFSPENLGKQIDLVSMESSRGTPLLGAPVRLSKTQAASGSPKVTLAALRRGTAGNGVLRTVPLFHGITSTKIPKRFSIAEVAKQAQDDVPRLFAQYLKDANDG